VASRPDNNGVIATSAGSLLLADDYIEDAKPISSSPVPASRQNPAVVFKFCPTKHNRASADTPRLSDFACEYALASPTSAELLSSLEDYNVQPKVYQPPFYSRETDAPHQAREYAGLKYYIKGGSGVGILEEWAGHQTSFSPPTTFLLAGFAGWEYAGCPPSPKQARSWLNEEALRITQRQRLKIARFQVCATIISCLFIPYIPQ
jgi:DNA polymerase zeta